MKKCFVIMPFSKTKNHTEEYWTKFFADFISEGLKVNGYEAQRSTASLNNITRDIVIQLAYADLVLAVLTDENPNVFYELGVRHSLRRGTIMILEKDHRPPFDVGHHGILFYDCENSNQFKQALKCRIEDAEKLHEQNPVNESVDYLEFIETINLAVSIRNECTSVIRRGSTTGIKTPVEQRLDAPLAEIRQMQEEWDRKGELNLKQISVILCDHKWRNEKLLLHAHIETPSFPSSELWWDDLMEGRSLFHEVIKRQRTGIRIAQIKQRIGRLTALAYETVEIPPVHKCVVIAEAHYDQ